MVNYIWIAMTKTFFIYAFLTATVLLNACKHQPEATSDGSDNIDSINVDSYDYNAFESYLTKDDGKVHIINFWATWCKPCVEELPFFEMINKQYSQDAVDVTLVSLDMPSMVEGHLIPFLEKHKITSEVILLDDPDSNYWIPKVDKDWTGAIPATIIYKGSKRKFYEKSFTFNELQQELKTFL